MSVGLVGPEFELHGLDSVRAGQMRDEGDGYGCEEVSPDIYFLRYEALSYV